MEDKFKALMGGAGVSVVREVDGVKTAETVFVRQLPIRLYPRLLESIDDESALVELYCDREKGWADSLSIESVEAVVEPPANKGPLAELVRP